LADFIVCQVAQVFTKLGRKAQIYNRSLGKIALKSDHKSDNNCSLKRTILYIWQIWSLSKIWQSEQSKTKKPKAWLAKTSNASREELKFDRKGKWSC